jgi:hypothetical protein
MTKKLSDLLNLPDSNFVDPVSKEDQKAMEDMMSSNKEVLVQLDADIDKIDAALPFVHDLDQSDVDLDELSTLAKDKAVDMLDLAFNVDPRFAGPIFQTASVLLGHAVTAKTAKMDKKLRMISLQLQKARLDHQILKDAKAVKEGAEVEDPIDGKGMVLDRNALLAEILKRNKPKTE